MSYLCACNEILKNIKNTQSREPTILLYVSSLRAEMVCILLIAVFPVLKSVPGP